MGRQVSGTGRGGRGGEERRERACPGETLLWSPGALLSPGEKKFPAEKADASGAR